MLVDCLVIYGLHYWEKKLKTGKAKLEQEAAQAQAKQNETDKKAKVRRMSYRRNCVRTFVILPFLIGS